VLKLEIVLNGVRKSLLGSFVQFLSFFTRFVPPCCGRGMCENSESLPGSFV